MVVLKMNTFYLRYCLIQKTLISNIFSAARSKFILVMLMYCVLAYQ